MSSQNGHISDYKVLEADDAEELSRLVMNAIRNRWQPFGNLAVATRGDGVHESFKLLQPIVQHSEWSR